MKKSPLEIADSEKYGSTSPATLYSGKAEKDRKSTPTIELTGKQCDAFGLCDAKVGDKVSCTIDAVVKAISQGDHYGSSSSSDANGTPMKITLSVTHASSDGGTSEDGSDPTEGEVSDANPSMGADADATDTSEGEDAEVSDDVADKMGPEEDSTDNADDDKPNDRPPKKKKTRDGIGYKKKPITPADAGL